MSDAYEIQCHRLRNELREARAEAESQARLVGMGAEIEYDLRAKLDAAERQVVRLTAKLALHNGDCLSLQGEVDNARQDIEDLETRLKDEQDRADRMAELLMRADHELDAWDTGYTGRRCFTLEAEIRAELAKSKGEA